MVGTLFAGSYSKAALIFESMSYVCIKFRVQIHPCYVGTYCYLYSRLTKVHWKRLESLDTEDFETFGGQIYLSEWKHTNMNVHGCVLCKSD